MTGGPLRPRVLILTDVSTWAWARKASHLARWLSDEFDIEVWPLAEKGRPPKGAALYHTFAFPHVMEVPKGSLVVTGITAHVWRTWGADAVRQWAAKAVAVHANSRLLEEEMNALALGVRVFYTPNGVCPEQFRRVRPRMVHDRLVVGHVGKPNPRKGSTIIEQACEIAGVELRTIQRRSAEALPVEAMLDFYQDLHLTLTASDMDGTPNPALEGAACEVAPLSNAIGNMPEFIEDGINGFLVERTVDAYVERLHWAKANLVGVASVGRMARESVLRSWSWQRQAEWVRTMWRAVLMDRIEPSENGTV